MATVSRAFDFAVSLVLLVLASPLFLLVAVLIKLDSPGPVFFLQERVGRRWSRFKMLKFRKMHHRPDATGPCITSRYDPRVTQVGSWLERTKLDELPQLINVLRGHMSLVGPRPPLPSEVDHYEWLFRKRLSIKPGITCLWQVSGRNQLSFREWMELDWRYVTNWSLWLDLKILLRTIPVVLGRRGAS